MSIQIGITERGDGGLDLSWEQKLNTVDGAIIITKCLVNKSLHDALLRHKDKLILHAGITGNGGTVYEPHVKPYSESLDALQELIDRGFPTNHIVLRCDPIIPNTDGLSNMEHMLKDFLSRNMGINRVRISILDNYPHVRERFANAGVNVLYNGYFQPLPSQFLDIATRLTTIFAGHDDIELECCAEPKLQEAANKFGLKPIKASGCCGTTDVAILGLQMPSTDNINPQNRKGCLCLNCKKELLTNPKPCPHKCIYCYWKG